MEKRKVALFAVNGEPLCFAHVLLNAVDLHKAGVDVKVIIEGSATRLLKDFNEGGAPFSELFNQVKEQGLIDCVCRVCSTKNKTCQIAEEMGLEVAGSMNGHPAISRYLFAGYNVITF